MAVLLLMGADSTPFDLKSVNVGIEKFAKNVTQLSIPKCSHWVQHDQPAVVIQHIRSFL